MREHGYPFVASAPQRIIQPIISVISELGSRSSNGSFFPQQQKLMGSSAQIGSGVCAGGTRRFREVPGRFRSWWVVPQQVPGKAPEGSGLGRSSGSDSSTFLEDWGLGMHVWGQVPCKIPEGPVVVTSSFTGLE